MTAVLLWKLQTLDDAEICQNEQKMMKASLMSMESIVASMTQPRTQSMVVT
jgi:hypothetical protein